MMNLKVFETRSISSSILDASAQSSSSKQEFSASTTTS
jgi:hypothetical protein